MTTRRIVTYALSTVITAAGSGMLLAQAPQAVGTWSPVGIVGQTFINGAAVALPDGRTLITGGSTPDGTPTDAVTIYDPVDNSTTSAGVLITPRVGHTATLLKDGRVLVVGGITGGLVSSDIELFDPASGTATLGALLPEPRTGHVAARLTDGTVLIAGGTTTDRAALQTAVIFDPATTSASPLAGTLQVARVNASATTLIDGRVLVAGGNDGTSDLGSAEIYDPYSQTFSIAETTLSVPRQGHSAVLLLHNGSVLIAGGTSSGTAQAGADLFLPSVFPDPFSYGEGEFASTGAMTAARSGAVAGPTSIEGYAFVAGGGSPNAEVYRFATIKTDKDDYAPGERAVITGSGWQPGEEVRLLFQEDPAVHDDYSLTVTANSSGDIYWDQWAPEEHDLNVRFYLMATGSTSRAQMTFTDGRVLNSVLLNGGTSVTVAPGASITATLNVTTNSNSGTGNAKWRGSSWQIAASASTPLANCVNSPDHDGVNTYVDNITIVAPTTPGTYNAHFRVHQADDCSTGQQSNTVTLTNAVVVTPATADQTITVTTAAPASAAYGGTFDVTATATSLLPVTISTSGSCSGGDTDGSATITMTSGSGTCTVNYNQAGNASYNAAPQVTSSTTAARADAVIVVTPYSVTYDGNAHTATGTATGAGGEDLSALLVLSGTTHTTAGSYPADAWTFSGDDNHNPDSGTVADAIARADAACSISGYTGTYDAVAHSATGSCVGVGSDGTLSGLDLGASFTNAPGGTATWAFAGGTNYNDQGGTVAIAISKADATCSISGYTGTFDAVAHGATGSCAGVSTDSAAAGSSLDLGASFTNAPGGTATWAFVGGANYNNQGGTVDIVIGKAAATIAVTGYSGVYDGLAHGATGTVTGVPGDLAAAGSSLNLGATFIDVPGGTAHWTFTGGTNYIDQSGTAAIVISQKALTVSGITANDKPFDGNTVATLNLGGATLVGVIAPDIVTLNTANATGTFLTAAVGGPKVVTITGLTIGGADASNYSLTQPTAMASITAWSLSGFFQPVGIPNTYQGTPSITSSTLWNTIKGGQTVPLKFNLYTSVGGTQLTNVADVLGFELTSLPCSPGLDDPVDPDFLATGGTTLRYDGTQFIQNWQTPKGANQCYRITMTARDQSQLTAFFKTK